MPAASWSLMPPSDQAKRGSRCCPYCERTFSRAEHLERHVRAHTREKPFRCQSCANCYSRRDTLLRHQRKHSAKAFNQADDPGVFQDNITVSNERRQADAGTQARDVRDSALPSTNTWRNYSSDRLESDSRSDRMPSSGVIPNHMGTTPQLINVDSTNDAVSPVAMQPFGPFDSQMSDPFEATELNFDFDWGRDLSSWLIGSTSDFENNLLSFATERIQSESGAPLGLDEQLNSSSGPGLNLQHLWFTHVPPSEGSHVVSGAVTPFGPRQEVDESYRQTMRSFLHIRALDTSLPSPDFINLCIRLYFTRFHAKFPVIHVPTFQPSKTNPMLLLSICSIGSLITGTADGLNQGAHIWEILNKAILAKWERLVVGLGDQQFAVLQAALLGQTFALLSGSPKHLAAAEAYHGTLISVARRSKMFHFSHKEPPQPKSFTEDVDVEWRQWAREEELIRTALGLYIHDTELSYLFHHEPLLRPSKRTSCAASDDLFAARHSKEWLSRLHQRVDAERSSVGSTLGPSGSLANTADIGYESKFTKYVHLQCISATILEERLSGRFDNSEQQALTNELVEFHNEHLRAPATHDVEVDILWHLSFVSLYTDFDLLERVIGRDGPQVADTDYEKVSTWAASLDARRTIIHIHFIRQKLEALPIGLVPAVHVPRAIFLVAICFYCAFSFGPTDETFSTSTLDFPEIKLIGTDPSALPLSRSGPATKELLCHLTDVLQRLGHWDISRKFGAIVEALLHRLLV